MNQTKIFNPAISGQWIWRRSMNSVSSRVKLASMEYLICSLFSLQKVPSSPRSQLMRSDVPDTLVARMTSSRFRDFRNAATALSVIPADSAVEGTGYISAVSKKFTPYLSKAQLIQLLYPFLDGILTAEGHRSHAHPRNYEVRVWSSKKQRKLCIVSKITPDLLSIRQQNI